MIADVAGEKPVRALAVAHTDDAVARELHAIAVLDRQAEAAELVEQAARMDVLRHRARERLEAGRGP